MAEAKDQSPLHLNADRASAEGIPAPTSLAADLSASFTASKTEGVAPLKIFFNYTGQVGPATWQWNFGDGSPNATTRTATHTFSQVGIYPVMLTVSNAEGSSTSCMRIVVTNADSLRLRTSGSDIIDRYGKAVVLNGSAICPYEAVESQGMTPADIDATLREMKSNWNMNAVRLVVFPQEWGTAYNTSGGYPSGKALYDLDLFVTACMRNGMYAIIDWHNYGMPDNANVTNPYIYNPCMWFWQNASALYGHESTVMFEIFNEPGWYPWSAWRPLAQDIVNAIRKNCSNLILVSGVRMAYYASDAVTEPMAGPNIAYSTHCYNDSAYHSGPWESVLGPVAAGYPTVMTEWGTYQMRYRSGEPSIHDYLHGIVWFMGNNGYDGMFAWNWDPGLGGTPLVKSIKPPFAYTEYGKYVNLVSRGYMPPYASINVNSTGTAGKEIQLNDTLGWGVTSWDWDFGDGTPHGTARNVTHTYSAPGSYTIVLKANNAQFADNLFGPDISGTTTAIF